MAPECLKQTFVKNKTRELRRYNNLVLPAFKTHYGEKTFSYFFIKLFNNFGQNNFYSEFKFFMHTLYDNIKTIFEKFVKLFSIFDIFYKNLDYLNKKTEKKQ